MNNLTNPDGINVPGWVCDDPQRKTVISKIITVRFDLAMNEFQAHGAEASVRAVRRRTLNRHHDLEFFGQLPACIAATEACAGEHL